MLYIYVSCNCCNKSIFLTCPLENGAPKMATECDRFCWQELNVDFSNLDSAPLKAMLTQLLSSEIKKKNAAQTNSLSPDVAFHSSGSKTAC